MAEPKTEPETPHADSRLIPGGLRWANAERRPFGMSAISKTTLPGMAGRPRQTDFADTPTEPQPRPAAPR